MRAAITIPLTVKFRAGVRDQLLNYVELGHICQEEGANAVALHPRTAKQMYRGAADWSRIAGLKDALNIPVVGNGDVKQAEDAVRMLRETGCDAVMIGRASMRNPWIYRQVEDLLQGRTPYVPTAADRRDLILGHFSLLREQEDSKMALHKLRTFTGWYTHGLEGGRHLRVLIGHLTRYEDFVDAVEQFFEEQEAAA